MKSFRAICLQFCVTLSAPFLTCHKNATHSYPHTHTHTRTTPIDGRHTTLPTGWKEAGSPRFQGSKLATRQGVTLINGSALLTPTSSLSLRCPLLLKKPFLPKKKGPPPQELAPAAKNHPHSLGHFAFIFHEKLFHFSPFCRVPISRKISFKYNKMQCRCHKSIPLDCHHDDGVAPQN